MPELLLQLPDGRIVRHPLGMAPLVVGRDANCEIVVDDPSTSRRHARFSYRGGGYYVEDLGSKNGTLVNDELANNDPLRDGDRILIGAALAVYRDREGGSTTSATVVISDDATTDRATRYAARDQRLLLSQRRLEMIYELSERLTTLQSQEALLDNAMDTCFETLQFERGAVGVWRVGQRVLDWPVIRNLRGAAGELSISRSLLNRALEHGERASFSDSSGNADPTMSIVQHGIRSAMCVPLIHRDQILGVIYGDRTSSATPYTSEDVDFLAGIAQQISIGLINARLLEEQKQMMRLHHDLEVARRIQTGLFPQALPNRDDVKVAALNDPGQRISGDYYDVIECGKDRLWCIIADVTGEGVSAALLMANMQASVRVLVEQTDDPAKLLTTCNRLICENTDGSKFITCLCVLIDPGRREVRLASAGHPPAVLISGDQGEPRELSPADTGFPLGVVADAVFTCETIAMPAESTTLFAYTDGVIEAMNTDGAQFGTQRLLETLGENRQANPLLMTRQVRKAVSQFVGAAPQSDDITMLTIRLG